MAKKINEELQTIFVPGLNRHIKVTEIANINPSVDARSYVNNAIYKVLKSRILHDTSNKNKSCISRKYFIRRGLSNWYFHAMIKDKKGNNASLYLYRASETSIKRHIRIKSEAHLYDPKFRDYFKHRECISKTGLTNSKSSFAFSTKLLGGNVTLLMA